MTWPLRHAVAVADDGLLVDAGVLVGALELGELIDVRADLARELGGVVLAFDTDDDALGVDRIDDAVALGQDDGAGVAGGDAFHAGADEGASETSRGTDWRCMLAPISARLASSCSRNGTSEAATETSCLGETST